MDNNKAPSKKSSGSFLDFNASWILMFIYIIYLGGMIFFQRSVYYSANSGLDGKINYYLFVFVTFIVGLIASVGLYNLSRVIVAKSKGYQVLYTKILGFTFYHAGKQKTRYSILDTFTLEMRFVPKDDDLKKNPRPIFLGGLVGDVLFIAICLVLFFTLSFKKTQGTPSYAIGYMALFAMIYGLIVPIYELIPLRQDAATDMYNLLVTKEEADREAFNLVYINRRRELTGEDFLVPEGESFDSYYRVKALYYRYLAHLYQDNMEDSVNDLVTFRANRKKLDDYDRYLTSSEAMYLRYLSEDVEGADKLYLTLKGEERNLITKPSELADYRTALLVVGYISSDKEQIRNIVRDYKLKLSLLEDSNRVQKEKKLFEEAYQSLRKAKPNLGLEEAIG